MICLSIFTTTEFYVTLFTVAAAIVAFSAKPRRGGPVRELFASGILNAGTPSPQPELTIEVSDSGTLTILRTGLEDVYCDSDAVSLAIAVRGYDIEITERIAPGRNGSFGPPASSALFHAGPFAAERYHIRYNSPSTQLSATITMSLRSGARFSKYLSK